MHFSVKKRLSKVFFLKNICTIQSFFVPLQRILKRMPYGLFRSRAIVYHQRS